MAVVEKNMNRENETPGRKPAAETGTVHRRSLMERVLMVRRNCLMAWKRFRYGLRHVHKTAYIASGVYCLPDLKMAEYSFINARSWICANVEIGRYAMLGPSVKVVGGDHNFESPGTPTIFAGRPSPVRTVIGNDAWIGCDAVIVAGVRIGDGAIIAAGTVVTRDVPDFEIHCGVPNRKLRDRFATVADREIHRAMLARDAIPGHYCPPERYTDSPETTV